jgi:hypothetical protein
VSLTESLEQGYSNMIRALAHALRPTRLRGSLVAVLVLLVGTACNSTDATDPTAVGAPVTSTDAATATATTAPTLASITASGIPYGPTSLWENATTLSAGAGPFTGSQVSVDPGAVLTAIATARQKNHRIVFAMTGGSSKQYTTNGKFDINKWKSQMSRFNTATIRNAVAQAVSDGIVVGNAMMDEPETVKWGGNVTKALLDQMAVYAKGIFPTLPQGVNVGPPAYRIWQTTARFTKVDWVRYQYSWWVTSGNVNQWRDIVLDQARKDGVQPAFSLNILDGGTKDKTGSWDCPGLGKGTYAPNCNMTADQVRSWGRTLAAAGGCAMFMWRYDNAYITKQANQDAFRDVASATNAAAKKSCKRP